MKKLELWKKISKINLKFYIKNIYYMWKEKFKKWKELILATSSKDWTPNANIVISLWFFDDKILISNCQMNTTINNLKENAQICVIGGYFRLKWNVEIISKWKYLEQCIKYNDWYKVKNAILITINEVFDLDKLEVL